MPVKAKVTPLAPLKKLLVPTLSAFLCFIFVVVRPISDLSGQYAFLTYTLQILFFFPSGRIGTQIEATLLGVTGATLSLGYCCAVLSICAALNRQTDSSRDTDAARAVAGVFLGLLAFACGLLRSIIPRLTNLTRIALFHAIFTLTSNQALTHLKSGTFLHLFLPTIFAAGLALIPSLLILPMSSSNHFSHLLLSSIHQTALTLSINLKAALSIAPPGATPPAQSKSLRDFPILLDQVYQELSFEVSYSKLHPRTLQSVLSALRRVQKNPLLGGIDVGGHLPGPRVGEAMRRERERRLSGTSRTSKRNQSVERVEREALTGAFIDSSFALSVEIGACLDVSRELLVVAYDWADVMLPTENTTPVKGLRGWVRARVRSLMQEPIHPVTGRRMSTLVQKTDEKPADLLHRAAIARKGLEEAMRSLEMRLTELVGGQGAGADTSTSETPVNHGDGKIQWASEDALRRRRANVLLTGRDRFRLAFHLTALLDVSKDVRDLLDVVNKRYQQSTKSGNTGKWYAPRLDWSWLRKRGDENVLEEDAEALEQGDTEDRTDRSQDEAARVGLTELADDPNYVNSLRLRRRTHSAVITRHGIKSEEDSIPIPDEPGPPPSFKRRMIIAWMMFWDADKMLEARIVLSRFLRRLKHSHHMHFALKLSVGITLLALPSWMAEGNRGREWFSKSRGAWTVISYMYVLEVTTGATLRVGLFRIMGTVSGAIAGYVCTRIAHTNPYGLVTLATACTVPISYLVLFTTRQGVGIVAGITLPPLLFINYLNLSGGLSDFDLAWNRAVDIMIGIVSAVLVNLIVFPVHARVRYLNIVAETLDHLTELYLRMSRDFLRPSLVYTSSNERYEPLEAKILLSIANSRSLVQVQRLEASLLPKPIKLYGEVADILERLFELLSDLRVLRLGVPRKETVLDVLPLRRDLISSILISLFACSHAFRSRSPLPQFLPTPRLALANVSAALNEHFEDIQALAQARHRTVDPSQASLNNELAVLYGFAENEALAEVCEALDELLTASKTLFGVQNFLGHHVLDAEANRMSFGDLEHA